MDQHRKDVIVKEILYWKENRMLPEHYCDFLLTLYTEGNRPKEKENKHSTKRGIRLHYLIIFLLIPSSVFVIYFTELSFILQIGLAAIFIFIGLAGIFYFSKKGISYQLPLYSTALIMLMFSVELISKISPDNQWMLFGILILNCFTWIYTGWKLALTPLIISGILGLGVVSVLILI